MNKIAIIGNGIQSKRIQKILKKLKKEFLIYKPINKKNEDKKNFKLVEKCKIIFICSPDVTHFEYIKKLNHNRFIFCEKIPVTKIKELNYLKKKNLKKIYFNYNFRFLKIGEILSNIKKYKLGKMLYTTIVTTKGIAGKKEYKKNWRFNKKKCPKGVFQIISIHILDLINFFFQIKKMQKPTLLNFSKTGDGFDTSEVKLKLKNNAIVNIFSSYYAPLFKYWLMIFENGIIKIENDNIEIKGPRNTFDKKGNFEVPKSMKSIKFSAKKDFDVSLVKSVIYFLNKCKNNKTIPRHHYWSSLKSNFLVLK